MGSLAQFGHLVCYVGSGQIDPADHSANERVLSCKGQELGGLLPSGSGLHQYRRGDFGSLCGRLQILDTEVAADRGEPGAYDPRPAAHGKVPHVYVSIHEARRSAHGRKGRSLRDGAGRTRRPAMPPSTASAVPVTEPADGPAR